MNAKISVFAISVEAIICLLLYNLHGRISIRRISVARMTHFANECFILNLHLKRMKFGLYAKP